MRRKGTIRSVRIGFTSWTQDVQLREDPWGNTYEGVTLFWVCETQKEGSPGGRLRFHLWKTLFVNFLSSHPTSDTSSVNLHKWPNSSELSFPRLPNEDNGTYFIILQWQYEKRTIKHLAQGMWSANAKCHLSVILGGVQAPRDGLRIESIASKCFPWTQQFVNVLYMGHMHPQAPNQECQNRTSLTISKQKSSGSAHWWKGVGMFPLSPSPKWPRAPGVPYELKNTLLSDLPWPLYQARHLVLFLLFQEWPSLVCCSILSLS